MERRGGRGSGRRDGEVEIKSFANIALSAIGGRRMGDREGEGENAVVEGGTAGRHFPICKEREGMGGGRSQRWRCGVTWEQLLRRVRKWDSEMDS